MSIALRMFAALTGALTVTAALAASDPAARSESNAPAALTAAQWRDDLRAMATTLERRHKNLYHTVSRQQFQEAVADLDRRIPELQRHEIIVGMMRIAAMVGDGHTNMSPLKDPKFGFRSLPIGLYLFEDGLFVRAADRRYAHLIGAEVHAIGGVPVQEALRRVYDIAPRDNEMGARFYAPIFLAMPEIAHALKLADSPEAVTFTLQVNGRERKAVVPAGAVAASWPPDTDVSLVTPEGWRDARSSAPQPLWLQAPLEYHRLVHLPEHSALYVQLNMVTNVEGQSLADFGRRIAAETARVNPRRLIVDLRLNRGGNHDLRYPFIADLVRGEDADTRLFVLVARGSFSATQAIVDDLDRYTSAMLIGEPASSKPNSYSDSYKDFLPNSGLTVRSSIYWEQRDQRNRPWTHLDLATPLRFADYAQGRDPALQAALTATGSRALANLIDEGADAASVVQAFDQYVADESNRYADVETQTLLAVRKLIAAKNYNGAVALAERGAATLPQSATSWVVLALAADRADNSELARRAGVKALTLDPNNREAAAMLRKRGMEAREGPAPGAAGP